MKPFAINSAGIKMFAVRDSKVKWQKGYGKTCWSKVRFDADHATQPNAPYFMVRGSKQYFHNFYKVK